MKLEKLELEKLRARSPNVGPPRIPLAELRTHLVGSDLWPNVSQPSIPVLLGDQDASVSLGGCQAGV